MHDDAVFADERSGIQFKQSMYPNLSRASASRLVPHAVAAFPANFGASPSFSSHRASLPPENILHVDTTILYQYLYHYCCYHYYYLPFLLLLPYDMHHVQRHVFPAPHCVLPHHTAFEHI